MVNARMWFGNSGTLPFLRGLLSYTGPAEPGETFTFSRKRHLEVDGKVADAVLCQFQQDKEQFVAVLERKGARDPLDHPCAGRRMSALDQAYPSAFITRYIVEQALGGVLKQRESLEKRSDPKFFEASSALLAET